jgi:hypothetical protein
MSQIEQQQETLPVDNNEKDDSSDNFSIVDGVDELCLDASGESENEKLQGSEQQQQQQKLDEITQKLAALEQKHQEEIADLKVCAFW